MVRRWTFRDYVAADGANEIHAWLDGLPKAAKVGINAAILRLEVMASLGMPDIRVLKGPCAGLMEVRIRANKVQYRPLSCYGPGRGELTLLCGAIEKGGRLEPLSACSTAQIRKTQITERGRTCEHDFS